MSFSIVVAFTCVRVCDKERERVCVSVCLSALCVERYFPKGKVSRARRRQKVVNGKEEESEKSRKIEKSECVCVRERERLANCAQR